MTRDQLIKLIRDVVKLDIQNDGPIITAVKTKLIAKAKSRTATNTREN